MKNSTLRVVLMLILAVAGGFFVQADFGQGAFDGRTAGLMVIAFVTARFSRALLVKRKYPSLISPQFPSFNGALWGTQEPLQAEIDIILIAFSVGVGALVIGYLLKHALSLGGALGVCWGLGDLLAVRSFLVGRSSR